VPQLGLEPVGGQDVDGRPDEGFQRHAG
jgi:hypothetical protein